MNPSIYLACATLSWALLAGAGMPASAAGPRPASGQPAPVSGEPSSAAASERSAAEPISVAELRERLDGKDPDVVVLDVRSAGEFAAGHVPGARNVPHDQVHTRLDELATLKDKQVVLYCRSGRRSGMAAQALREAGFTRLRQLEGDFPGWEAARQPVER